MIRAIIFDFDGVLVESVDVKTQAFRKLFAAESPQTLERIVSYHLQNGGVSRFEKFRTIHRTILQKSLPQARFQKLCDQFARLVINEVVAAPWVRGAKEFLNTHKNHFDFHIITGTPQSEIDKILTARRIRHYFQHVYGSPQPKSTLLKKLLKAANLKPHQTVFVGDSPTDWNAAQKTRVPFIWRKAPDGNLRLDNYTGPRMTSLESLAHCIEKLIHSKLNPRIVHSKPILTASKRKSH